MRQKLVGTVVVAEGQPLSAAEQRVYNELMEGDSYEVIAGRLKKTVRTVRFHSSNIFIKMGVYSRLQLTLKHYKGLLGKVA